MKILVRFPGNPTLEILIKIHNCVGSTNMRGRFLMKVCLFPIYNCPVILGYFLGWVYLILVNLRNFNPRKIQFFVSFLCKTIFAVRCRSWRPVSKDVEFYCASFDISEKFVASCPPMDTPTRKLKNEFSGRNSQGIYPNLEYFGMILKALQTLIFKIKIHQSVKKTPKSSEFSLHMIWSISTYLIGLP